MNIIITFLASAPSKNNKVGFCSKTSWTPGLYPRSKAATWDAFLCSTLNTWEIKIIYYVCIYLKSYFCGVGWIPEK